MQSRVMCSLRSCFTVSSRRKGAMRATRFLQRDLSTRCRAAAPHQLDKHSWICKDHGTPRAVYIHLPFCKKRCFYCDFPVQAVGHDVNRPAVQGTMDSYVEVLCQEIEQWEATKDDCLKTVFLGGGTPSLIPPALLDKILALLRRKFRIDKDAEISMEADPGTFDSTRLSEYQSLGVNRFSIGVQAFQEEALAACGRSHSLQDVCKAIDDVKAAQIQNWSLDLISGLPNVSLQDWESSLRQAVAAQPTHVSVYDLQVEENTRFGRVFSPGQFPLPDDDTAADMYTAASRILQGAGMEHYEVSSYALPNHRCRHNMVYWSGKPYMAFGLGAASYTGWHRFSRPKSMAAYKTWVSDLAKGLIQGPGSSPIDPEEVLLDHIMLSLRQSDGLDLANLSQDFGVRASNKILSALGPHIKTGLVQASPSGVRLKDPDGFLMSNSIISDVFAALD